MIAYRMQSTYKNITALFNAIKTLGSEVWNETTETSVTLGNASITLDADNSKLLISDGYWTSRPQFGSDISCSGMAVTENGFIMAAYPASSYSVYVYGISVEENGNYNYFGGNIGGGDAFISAGRSAGSLSDPQINPTVSDTDVQLVRAVAQHGSFVSENAYRLLLSPNTGYNGKIEVDGEKFFELGAWALKYTD